MAKTLIICGHPNYKASIANHAILEEVKKQLPDVEVVILSELYPDFNIDVACEQKRLQDVDIIVFEYPMQWYDAHSLMHRYVELVFAYGFAYGRGGNVLKGKKFILSFTAGASEKDYTSSKYPMPMLISPMLSTSSYVGLDYVGAIISYSMIAHDHEDKKSVAKIVANGKEHAEKLVQMIRG